MTEFAAAASEVIVSWLASTTVHVVVLVALAAAIHAAVGRRLTPRWRYALWGLVAIRLLLPVVPDAPFSVHRLTELARGAETAPAPAAEGPNERVNAVPFAATTPLPRVRTATTSAGAKTGDRATSDLALDAAAAVPDARAAPTTAALALLPDVAAPRAAASLPGSAVSATTPWRLWLAGIWAAGFAAVLGWTLLREVRFARAVRREPPDTDARVRRVLDGVLASRRVRRAVVLVRSELVDTPALTGVIRPRILLPGALLGRLDDDELRHVLSHEVAHLAAGDVAKNWALALLTAVHWFDPCVWYAFARLRTEREAVRDLAANHGEPQEQWTAYGRTLLRLMESGATATRERRPVRPVAVGLAERRGDLRRRIEMIANGGRGGRRAWWTGALLTAAVAAVALTGGEAPTAAADDGDGDRDAVPARVVGPDGVAIEGAVLVRGARVNAAWGRLLPGIHVERRSPEPQWRRALRTKLAQPLDVESGEVTMSALLELVRTAAHVNVVVEQESRAFADRQDVTLPAGQFSAQRVLRLACRQAQWRYALVDGAVLIGDDASVASDSHQRFYRVAPLVDAAAPWLQAFAEEDPEDARAIAVEWLVEVVRAFAGGEEAWDRRGVSISVWNGLLLVQQDDETHAAVEGLLNMLLTRGREAAGSPAWRAQVDEALAMPVSINFKEAPLDDAIRYLSGFSGLPIVVPAEHGAESEVTLRLDDVSVATAINWLARGARLHVALDDGVVQLTETPPLVVRVHEIGELVDDELPADETMYLEELIRDSVAPATWEQLEGVDLAPWNGMFLVRTTARVHAEMDEFLGAARRALGTD